MSIFQITLSFLSIASFPSSQTDAETVNQQPMIAELPQVHCLMSAAGAKRQVRFVALCLFYKSTFKTL